MLAVSNLGTVLLPLLVSYGQAQLLPPSPPKAVRSSPFENVEPLECTSLEGTSSLRSGMVGERYRWKRFNVYPDNSFNAAERQAINDALWTISQVIPCIPFGIWQPGSTVTGDYVYITKGSTGCWSHVGRVGGRQTMNLQSPRRLNVGTIMHEMIHALGFHHEHNRPDRDDYVNIHWENIRPGHEHNFHKSNLYSETFGVPYNFQSIMHYDSLAFSRSNNATITTKSGGIFGRSRILQESDKKKLRRMYKC